MIFHNFAGLIIMWARHAIAIITVYVTKYCRSDEVEKLGVGLQQSNRLALDEAAQFR